MRHLPTIARVLLGLMFTVFGLNGLMMLAGHPFIPQPAPPPAAGAFGGAMVATGYLFHLLKVTEVASGLLLLFNRFVPLALTLLAPIIVNITFFHLFLAPSGLPLPIVILALEIYLAWSYRGSFRPMLNARAQPSS